MLFSELYSAYYNTVARILETAFDMQMTEADMREIVSREAFSESALKIIPSLKSGKWPLLNDDLSPVLKHRPTMPLTLLEKRWLKAVANDPRIKLFDVEMPELSDVEPLFTREDYRIYDQYSDGDPFEDERYICNFRLLLSAMREHRQVAVSMKNRHGRRTGAWFCPRGFEYSLKDDKIRVIAEGCRFRYKNLGRIESCEYYTGERSWRGVPFEARRMDLTLEITNGRNALERAMMHFAHFEKRTERVDDEKYILHLKYYEDDETEMVIRVLSFGPYVKVIAPQHFVNLIKERLTSQINCGLK